MTGKNRQAFSGRCAGGHEDYLKKVGFVKREGSYEKILQE